MKLAELVAHIGDDLVKNLKSILTNMVFPLRHYSRLRDLVGTERGYPVLVALISRGDSEVPEYCKLSTGFR